MLRPRLKSAIAEKAFANVYKENHDILEQRREIDTRRKKKMARKIESSIHAKRAEH